MSQDKKDDDSYSIFSTDEEIVMEQPSNRLMTKPDIKAAAAQEQDVETIEDKAQKEANNDLSLGLEAVASRMDFDDSKAGDQSVKNANIFPRKLLILYAGETGNSEDVARRAGWEAKRRRIDVRVKPFDDYSIRQLVHEKLVIMICSTTNQGDEPAQMLNFWSFIMRRGLPYNALSDVQFGVIALGDSSYLRYNVVGKKLHNRMKQLGAQSLLDVCLGDDQHDLGLDAAVRPWLNNFWTKIETLLQSPSEQIESEEALPEPTYLIKRTKKPETNLTRSTQVDFSLDELLTIHEQCTCVHPRHEANHSTLDLFNLYQAQVLSNDRVTADDHFQETKFMQLGLCSRHPLKYEAGDVAMILPENLEDECQELISLIGLTGQERIICDRQAEDFLGQCLYDTLSNQVISISSLLKRYTNFRAVPKCSFFELMWRLSTDPTEKQKLKEFASTEGQQDLYNYCIRPKRNILEVLTDFPHTSRRVKLEYLLDMLPAIQPKPYSIASSLNQCPNELHILYAVVEFKTLLKKPRLGFCTNFLKRQTDQNRVSLYIRKGTFRIQYDQTPLIMVCTGTGVAPFRSIIQERIFRNISTNFLFFGCRNKNKDFYFRDEWIEDNARGMLNCYPAFSRDTKNKVYVQNRLWEHRALIFDLLSRLDANLIVAGSSGEMPKQARATLVSILQSEGGEELDSSNSETVVDRFEQKGRLQYECWT